MKTILGYIDGIGFKGFYLIGDLWIFAFIGILFGVFFSLKKRGCLLQRELRQASILFVSSFVLCPDTFGKKWRMQTIIKKDIAAPNAIEAMITTVKPTKS